MPNRRLFVKGALALSGALRFERKGYSLMRGIPPSSNKDAALPGEYFRRLAKWCPVVQDELRSRTGAGLRELETQHGWSHFPYTILAAAVLYAKKHPTNRWYKDASMLALALEIGDLLVKEDERGTFAPRLDSYRDTYMWVESYALLKTELGAERARTWKAAIERNIGLLEGDIAAWKDCPAYTENFLGTSPNHYAWWSATLLVGGKHFDRPTWVELGSAVLRRFAATEQNPDGYWGEHNPDGPTIGYNYLTTLGVGVYWEHSQDPSALRALRRATDFHEHFTYPDGNACELMNDRNRYWEVSPWGQFAFSNFADGRGYAALLVRNIPDDVIDLDTLGMLAQDALYYHEGPVETCAPKLPRYSHRLEGPAGVRKDGPWVTALSGIIDTPLPLSQWFLDRQANVSLFHERTGLIIAGANSKGQPELATFYEKSKGTTYTKPLGSRLTMKATGDCLAVAHHTFTCEILTPPAKQNEQQIRFQITGRGPVPDEAYLALQLCLKAGTVIETGAGHRIALTDERFDLTPAMLGGSIHHRDWTLKIDADAALSWPVFPYNPYRNGPETKLEFAVGLLRFPLRMHSDPNHYVRPNEQTIRVTVQVPQTS
ncbi:hypothetical protein [Edaphobacter sp.]|uniref:hypothetical protein n=1 Tax=Edaphobacter sp. TaxID=1934404 RepID=UPI002DBB054F|nr:hypothetical protein [Edaphobacter sp.]HEU5341357.1 hypothetical protein [Edaphobacter sp.]